MGASLMNKLSNIEGSFEGYALLGLEFMELAAEQNIISDQKLVSTLLGAFDELIK